MNDSPFESNKSTVFTDELENERPKKKKRKRKKANKKRFQAKVNNIVNETSEMSRFSSLQNDTFEFKEDTSDIVTNKKRKKRIKSQRQRKLSENAKNQNLDNQNDYWNNGVSNNDDFEQINYAEYGLSETRKNDTGYNCFIDKDSNYNINDEILSIKPDSTKRNNPIEISSKKVFKSEVENADSGNFESIGKSHIDVTTKKSFTLNGETHSAFKNNISSDNNSLSAKENEKKRNKRKYMYDHSVNTSPYNDYFVDSEQLVNDDIDFNSKTTDIKKSFCDDIVDDYETDVFEGENSDVAFEAVKVSNIKNKVSSKSQVKGFYSDLSDEDVDISNRAVKNVAFTNSNKALLRKQRVKEEAKANSKQFGAEQHSENKNSTLESNDNREKFMSSDDVVKEIETETSKITFESLTDKGIAVELKANNTESMKNAAEDKKFSSKQRKALLRKQQAKDEAKANSKQLGAGQSSESERNIFESNDSQEKFTPANDVGKGIGTKTSRITLETLTAKGIATELQNDTIESIKNSTVNKKLSARQKRALLNQRKNSVKSKTTNIELSDKLSESKLKNNTIALALELKKTARNSYETASKGAEQVHLDYSDVELVTKATKKIGRKLLSAVNNQHSGDTSTMTDDVYNEGSSLFQSLVGKGASKALKKLNVYKNQSVLSEELNKTNDSLNTAELFKRMRKKNAVNEAVKTTTQNAKNAAVENILGKTVLGTGAKKAFIVILSNPHTSFVLGCIVAIILLIVAICASCGVMVASIGNGIIATTYMTDEKEIYDASVYYTKLEADLQSEINDKIKKDEKSSSWDEVRYNIDVFQHDPEVLISYLSAQYPGWSFDLNLKIWFADWIMGLNYETVKDVEKDLLKSQYTLEVKEYWEWHYPSADAMFPIKWEVKEYILTNNSLETVVSDLMDNDTKEYYDNLIEYRGDRVWFSSPVDYNWKDVVANLCGYTVKGSNSFISYSNTSNLTYKDDGSTVSSGTVITLPPNQGKYFTYMGWQTITSPSSAQYKLREEAGMNFDAEGFGIINNRYVVAVTSTYGSVGDYIDVYQSDGTVFPCVIGDIKNQSDFGCNKWGHQFGKVVIEFVVDKSSWYPSHPNPGTNSFHSEWGGKTITKIVNVGSYKQGELAPAGGSDEGIIDSSQLIDALSTDVTPHKGIDIAGTSKTNVYAIFDGTIKAVTNNAVSIQSSDGEYQVVYDSIQKISVHNGQEIKSGDLIGVMADTETLRNNNGGYVSQSSTGIPHVHIELRNIIDNQQYNPYFYMDFGTGEPPQIMVGNGATGQLVPGNSDTGNLVAQYALSRVGYIYLWGGGHSVAEVKNPNSTRFDCSGLVCWAFAQADAYIGVHNTKELATMGTPVSYSDMQTGDIILWSSNGNASGVHHVAIYIGNGQMVEAPYDGQPIRTGAVYDKNQIYTIRRLYSN